ncbi:MAG: squalene/phytoene synthase family protein [Elusimicrobia bacterium]|nr:squalene/phytoene synthase family protein [Elusimicrobiota bacterium]
MEKHSRVFDADLKRILKNVSRTFYLSINILPDRTRAAMAMGYLLCRALDTVTDCIGPANGLKREILALSRSLDDKKISAELSEKIKRLGACAANPREKELLLRFDKLLAVYLKLPESDRVLINFVCDGVARGMEMDLEIFAAPGLSAFKTEEELKKYCGCIGGIPGIFWARLYRAAIRHNNISAVKYPSEQAAFAIGSALQMTNILKDMSADLKAGRCYLPQSDLSPQDLLPQDLFNPINMERLQAVVYKWIAWAVDQLDMSEEFVASIPKTELAMRAAVIWPVYWAMDTLAEVVDSNLLDPADRPRIKRNRIYSTIALTPPLLLSNTAFARGYRFRRETLIVSINQSH